MTLSALFHAWQTAQKLAQTKKVQYLRIPAQLLLSLCLACLCLHATITHLSSPLTLMNSWHFPESSSRLVLLNMLVVFVKEAFLRLIQLAGLQERAVSVLMLCQLARSVFSCC